MKKAYKFRLFPTKKQEQKLFWMLARCRELYNAALSERRQAYKLAGKSISYLEQANQLPEIKQTRTDLKSTHAQILQECLKAVRSSIRRILSPC